MEEDKEMEKREGVSGKGGNIQEVRSSRKG
jgi:hypothetical protein